MRFFRLVAIGVVLLVLVGSILGMACTSATGEQGPKGDPGADGVGIESVIDNSDGTITIGLTDGSEYTTDMVTGPQGPEGPQGLQGPQGEPGLLGAGVAWQGEWNSSTVYDLHDAVGYQGSSYVSKQDGNTNHLPTDKGWWDRWVAKGDTGDTGPQGIQGEPGPNMIVAMGCVDWYGNLIEGYNVASCAWVESPSYDRVEISFNDFSYVAGAYVTMITPFMNTAAYPVYNGADGKLHVVMFNDIGSITHCGFSFMILEFP